MEPFSGIRDDVLEAYDQLDLSLKDAYSTPIKAINAGVLRAKNIYKDIFLLIDTNVPRFTRFKVDLNRKDWYVKLTETIRKRRNNVAVDVVYDGKVIAILPVNTVITLANSHVKLGVVDRAVSFNKNPQVISSVSVTEPSTAVVKVTSGELVEDLRKRFVAYLQSHPEANTNMIPIIQLLNDGNASLNFVNDWIKAAADLPGETLDVFESILRVIDPSPAVTPIVNAFAQANQSAATTTAKRISGTPSVDVVIKAFNEFFNPTKVIETIDAVIKAPSLSAQVSMGDRFTSHPQSSSSSSSSHTHLHGKKKHALRRNHTRDNWKYSEEDYDNVTIGDAYSLEIKAQDNALRLNVGSRLMTYDQKQSEFVPVKSAHKITSGNKIYVELDPMISKNTAFLSKTKNFFMRTKPYVIIGLFRVAARDRTDYAHAYFLTLAKRNKRTRAITQEFTTPAISLQSKYRIVIWEMRRGLDGKTVWGGVSATSSSVPASSQTIDFVSVPVSGDGRVIQTYDSHPYMNAEMDLFRDINKLSIESVQARIDMLNNTYELALDPSKMRLGSESETSADAENVGSMLLSDTTLTLPLAMEYIKRVTELIGKKKATPERIMRLSYILSEILDSKNPYYYPIIVGPLHDGLGRNRTAQEFVDRGLKFFGPTYAVENEEGVVYIHIFGADNDGIRIFGKNKVFLAFSDFIENTDDTLLAAVKSKFPDFKVNDKTIPSLADVTGDHFEIDKDSTMDEDPKLTALNAVVDVSAGSADIIDGLTKSSMALVKKSEDLASKTLVAAEHGLEVMGNLLMDLTGQAVHAVVGTSTSVIEAASNPAAALPSLPASSSVSVSTPVLSSSLDISPLLPPPSPPLSQWSKEEQVPNPKSTEHVLTQARRSRSTVITHVKKTNKDYAPHFPPIPPRGGSQAPVGDKITANDEVKTRGGQFQIDFVEDYKDIRDHTDERFHSKLLMLYRIILAYKGSVTFYKLMCVYKTVDQIAAVDDPEFKVVPNSQNTLGYKYRRLYVILKRGQTDLKDEFWPFIVDHPEVFEQACILANNNKKLPLISDAEVSLHIMGHDTDFAYDIGQPLASLEIHHPNNKVQVVSLAGSTVDATVGDINRLAGTAYNDFHVLTGEKRHQTIYVEANKGLPLKQIYKSLPSGYRNKGALILGPGADLPVDPSQSFAIGNEWFKRVAPDLSIGSKAYVFISPSDAELLGKTLTAEKFIRKYILKVKRTKDGHKLKSFKKSSISSDFSTITLKGQTYPLIPYSNTPLLYIVSK